MFLVSRLSDSTRHLTLYSPNTVRARQDTPASPSTTTTGADNVQSSVLNEKYFVNSVSDLELKSVESLYILKLLMEKWNERSLILFDCGWSGSALRASRATSVP